MTLTIFSGLHLVCGLTSLLFKPLKLIGTPLSEGGYDLEIPDVKSNRSKSLQDTVLLTSDDKVRCKSLFVKAKDASEFSASTGCLVSGKMPVIKVESKSGLKESNLKLFVEDGIQLKLAPTKRTDSLSIRPLTFCKDVFSSRGSAVNISTPYRIEKIEDHHLSAFGIDPPSDLSIEDDEKPAPMTSVYQQILDINFLIQPAMFVLGISNFLGDFGQYLPYIYLPNMMSLEGIPSDDASYSIAAMGFTNMVARVVIGLIIDLPCVSAMAAITTSFILSGLSMILMPLCSSYVSFIVVESIYGFSIAAYVTTFPILLVDLFGTERLTTSFGLIQLSRGVGVLLGPFTCGMLFDQTQTYLAPFVLGGSFFIMGGILNCFARYLNSKKVKEDQSDTTLEISLE